MAKQRKGTDPQQDKKARPSDKEEQLSDQQESGLVGPGTAAITGGLTEDSIRAQAAQLTDSKIPTVQRQAIAADLGRLTSNTYMQRLINEVARLREDDVTHDIQDQGPTDTLQRLPEERFRELFPQPTETFEGEFGEDLWHGLTGAPGGEAPQPAPPTPAELAQTPAQQVSQLPEEVRQAHQAHVEADEFQQAIDVVVQHMASEGQIDMDLMRTEANPGQRQDICHGADCFIIEDVPGAFTLYCDPISDGTRNLPNPRIKINPSKIRRLVDLHSTLLHEYRHIQQRYAAINQRGIAGGRGDCLNCNDPGEMDAYLSEVEFGYDRILMMEAFARAYVTFAYLAPEQQAVFQSRRDAAEEKINDLYPEGTVVNWEENSIVASYRRHSEGLVAAHEGRTGRSRPFYCNRPMAPLSPGTTSGSAPASGTD